MPERMRDLLVAVADEIDPGAPPAEFFARARRRAGVYRGGQLAGVFVLVVLAVAVPAVVLRHGAPAPVAAPTASAAPSALPASDAARVSAWRWSSLPHAPIAGRIDEAYAWTGRELLVWGGATPDGEHPYADGAAYDPAARTWRTLPAAPLSARRAAAYAWTGSKLFVWSGAGETGASAGDGALYDPATRTWSAIAPAPIRARAFATALWVGGRVVVIGGNDLTGPAAQTLDVAAYDPATDRWQRLPDLPRAAGGNTDAIAAVAAGDTVYALAFWDSAVGPEVRWGIGAYALRPGAVGWEALATPPAVADNPPLWTGSSLLVPAGQHWYGRVPGPNVIDGGHRLDPATGTWTAIAPGPVDRLTGKSLWTGAAMVTLDTGTEISGPDGTTRPGQAAVWDPAANRWTSLPPAPNAGATAAVYTGAGVLLWGPSVALALGPAR